MQSGEWTDREDCRPSRPPAQRQARGASFRQRLEQAAQVPLGHQRSDIPWRLPSDVPIWDGSDEPGEAHQPHAGPARISTDRSRRR